MDIICMSTFTTEFDHTTNTCKSTAIRFQRIWWINEFDRLTVSSLVLVLGNCGKFKGLVDKTEGG